MLDRVSIMLILAFLLMGCIAVFLLNAIFGFGLFVAIALGFPAATIMLIIAATIIERLNNR